ncbi:MAG: CapA family protein [Christensenellales bacterium]
MFKKTALPILIALLLFSGLSRATAGAGVNCESKNSASFTLTAVGDIMMHDEQIESAFRGDSSYDFSQYFAHLRQRLSHADVTLANMEAPVVPYRPYEGFPHFNSPPQLLEEMAKAGIDIASVCNNHSLDQNIDGAKETLEQLRSAGITPLGMYDDESLYFDPLIREINGVKVAFLAYTEHVNGREKHFKKEDLKRLIKIFNKDEAAFDIFSAKRAGADVVVVMMHWGKEYEDDPSPAVMKLAEELAITGADIIIGSHPHVVQTCEIKTVTRADGLEHDVFIAYSLGNFISNQTLAPRQYGVIVDLEVEYDFALKKLSFKEAAYTPTYVWKRPNTSHRGAYDFSVLACGDYTSLSPHPAGEVSEAYLRYINRAHSHICAQMAENIPLFDYYRRAEMGDIKKPAVPLGEGRLK